MSTPHVLVIDDDDIVREVMCDLLRAAGCEVFDSATPIGVSRLIAQHKIDVVVLDVMMPDMSGDKLAKLLRGNSRLTQLAIVLVSSGNPDELRKIALDVNADSIVSKSELRQQLSLVVLQSHRRRALARVMQ
jgi:two-component system OmpR family response regulator